MNAGRKRVVACARECRGEKQRECFSLIICGVAFLLKRRDPLFRPTEIEFINSNESVYMGTRQRKSSSILSAVEEFFLMAVIKSIFIISINSVHFNRPHINAVTPHRLVMYLYTFYFGICHPALKI